MKAYELSAKVTSDGKLEFPDFQLEKMPRNPTVRVIILVNESSDEEAVDTDSEEEFSAESFRTSWQQAMTDQTLPLSQLWEGADLE